MTIKQALKQKNRLVSDLNDMWNVVLQNNSIEAGNPKHYDINEILKNITDRTEELVELKARIHTANRPMYSEIFKMSELKNYAKRLKGMSTEEGKVASPYRGVGESVKEVQINSKQLREMVLSLQSKIEEIQDRLDLFNATTDI